MGIGVEVKDETRFPDKWAYFNFDEETKSAEANPKAACWQCHEDHAAVEHSFAQFYPTVKAVARKFGTYKQERENVAPRQVRRRALASFASQKSLHP
jgi:cytochrome P460